jgi:hypothetical protein
MGDPGSGPSALVTAAIAFMFEGALLPGTSTL